MAIYIRRTDEKRAGKRKTYSTGDVFIENG